ncbi:MAG: SIR2 family protein [Bacteroidales bacterium]|nr:SIR2 family protein [Bacteroidales bacterium]
MTAWNEHRYRVGTKQFDNDNIPDQENILQHKKNIESWLSAVFQSEHLSLLLGSGFTTAIASQSGVTSTGMSPDFSDFPFKDELEKASKESAEKLGRGEPNMEDQIRVSNILLQGLQIQEKTSDVNSLIRELNKLFSNFLKSLLETERKIIENISLPEEEKKMLSIDGGIETLTMLVSFLLSFSSRTASRERLQIFTTNYDRLIEYGADLAGLHVLDRFIGTLEPVFRSSRLDIDMHYNPPGIRGEPRYLEGVVRLTKLHGSLDWSYKNGFVRKIGLPFGATSDYPSININPSESVMIYPNAAKDRETTEYPYVELFRDYAVAVCRPNSVLVTYGYGFGDDHINRVISDMLTIPSTHLVIISYSDEGGRISKFCTNIGREAQISLLIGSHFGSMSTLVEHYLPKPAIDRISIRQADLLRNRGLLPKDSSEEGEIGGDKK